MIALRIFLCTALLLPAIITDAADATNSSPLTASKKSPTDIEGSPEWVHKSLQEGDSEAVIRLGSKYASGDGVARDGKKAVRLFVSVAAVGSNRAEYFMALSFSRGVGVPINAAKALDWLRASALDGYPPAQAEIGRLFRQGLGGPQDYTNALTWYARAAAQGYSDAQADLGAMYEEGLGVKADLVEALKWLQLAFIAGDKNAIPRLHEVMALMDSSQQQEAQLRARSFKPVENNLSVSDDSKPVVVPLGSFFQMPAKVFGGTNFIIVDTGSSSAVLDVNLQDRLGEPLANLTGNTSSTSKANFKLWDCPDIFIGERRFAPLLTTVENFQKLRQSTGEPIRGIVGMSCLRYEVLSFDSDNLTLSIGGSVPEAVKKNALALPLIIKSDSEYCIEAFINGHGPVLLVMDTGDVGSIDLSQSDWQKVFAGQPPHLQRVVAMDAEGKIVEDYNARLRSVVIGTNTYANLISGALANPEIHSRFGQEFIKRHVCYVDFPNRVFYLQPGRQFARADERDMSGLRLLNFDGEITVVSADDQSPAYKAGIRTGDHILSLNGRETASQPLQSIRETLKTKPGNEIRIKVKNGVRTKSVKFHLKRLI